MRIRKGLIDAGIILTLTIFVIVVTVIFMSYEQLAVDTYILFAINTLLIVLAYWWGLVRGLIAAMVAVFCYGTYLMYSAFVSSPRVEITYQQLVWLFLFPFSSYVSGNLSRAITVTLQQSESYIHDMENLVLLDRETGFSNPKKFYIDLSEEISRAKRYGTPLSIMLIKVQYFDELMSVYGDTVCRNAVISIGKRIAELTRDIDKKARLEKDKFALILSNTDEKGALVLKERLANCLEKLEVSDEKDRRVFKFSLKFGIAQLKDKDEDPIAFKERAERELEYDVG